MRKFAFFLFLTITLCVAEGRTVTGRVVAETDSCAVPGALCQIMDADTEIASTTTDNDGRFAVTTDRGGKLLVRISMPGMATTDIMTGNGGGDIALGDIFITDAEQLGEIEVTAATLITSRGRSIVYPTRADVAASATSLDLLQKLPLAGLEINPINRSITVSGASPVILINGVPSTAAQVTELSPKDIARVEFSRFTPPRWASDGYRGVINITLKKREDGGQVFAWTRSAVTTAFVDASLSGSYHQGNSQFSLSYAPSWRNYQNVYDYTEERFIAPDFDVTLKSEDRNPFSYFTNNLRLKYDYSPSAATVFSATLGGNIDTDQHRLIGTNEDSRLGSYASNNTSRGNSLTPSLDLYFRRDFNDRNSLEAQVVGTLLSESYDRSNVYTFSDGTSSAFNTDIDSRRHSLISALSYQHRFGESTSLSAGFQNTLSRSRNIYKNTDYEPRLEDNNNYLYAALGQQIGNVYLNLSSGLKHYQIENDLNRRRFLRNISSIEASWTGVKNLSVEAEVRYSPSIPSLTALTDYPQQTTPYLIRNGNPNLKVAERLSSYASATYLFGKVTAAYEAGYSRTWNNIISDIRYLGDGRFLSQSINARHTSRLRQGLFIALQDFHGFGGQVYATVTRYNSVTDTWDYSLTSFEASIAMWYNFGRFSLQYWRKFPGKSVDGYYVYKNENADQLSLNYTVSDNLKLSAAWMYMFEPKGTRYPNWSYSAVNPSYTERNISNNANMVVLSLTYNANFGSIFRTSKRSLNNSDTDSSILKL